MQSPQQTLQSQELCLKQGEVFHSSMFGLRTPSRPPSPTNVTPSLGWNYSSAALAQKTSELAWREASWPSFLAGSVQPHLIRAHNLQSCWLLLQVKWLPYPQGMSREWGKGCSGHVYPNPTRLPLKAKHLSGLTCNLLKHLHWNCFVIIANCSQ